MNESSQKGAQCNKLQLAGAAQMQAFIVISNRAHDALHQARPALFKHLERQKSITAHTNPWQPIKNAISMTQNSAITPKSIYLIT